MTAFIVSETTVVSSFAKSKCQTEDVRQSSSEVQYS